MNEILEAFEKCCHWVKWVELWIPHQQKIATSGNLGFLDGQARLLRLNWIQKLNPDSLKAPQVIMPALDGGTRLGPFWDHSGTILGPFWDHSGDPG